MQKNESAEATTEEEKTRGKKTAGKSLFWSGMDKV